MLTTSLRRSGGSLIVTIPQSYIEQNQRRLGRYCRWKSTGRNSVLSPLARGGAWRICSRRRLKDYIAWRAGMSCRRWEASDEAPIGDILHLQFDPASGREMQGPSLLSRRLTKAFNQRFQLALVCPISVAWLPSPANRFLIPLAVLARERMAAYMLTKVKSLDWKARKPRVVRRAPHTSSASTGMP